MQGCLEFHSLVDPTIYLFELNQEVPLSLGIMIHDARRQMLTSVILLWILYMGWIKNKYSNNINDERNKESSINHLLLFKYNK